jgi:hypothetical protein
LSGSQPDRHRHQALLGAVMEVALDPPSLLVARRDDAGAGLLYERELRTQLCLEPSVLESQVGGGSDCVHELALLLEGRVVYERGDHLAVVLDRGHDTAASSTSGRAPVASPAATRSTCTIPARP